MSKATHTPGPWHAGWLDAQNGWILDDADKYLAQIVTSDEEGKLAPRKEHKANALLLASAPDLLEACKNMLWHEDKYAARKQAEAAIAKAEGR